MRYGWLIGMLTMGLAGVGCSDSNDAAPPTGGGGGNNGMNTAAGGDTGSGSDNGGCTPQVGVEPGPDWVCITDVNGGVVDENGGPLPDILMTVCGPGGCEPDTTDDSGSFAIDVGFPILTSDYSLIPHSREYDYFVYYFPFAADAAGPVIDMGPLTLLSYPPTTDRLVVKTDEAGAPAQTATNGDVTIDVPAGTRVNLDFEDVLLGEEGKRFLSRRVDPSAQDAFIDPSFGAVALYALAPFDAGFDLDSAPGTPAKVQLTFDNTAGLAADTPVQFYQQGSFIVGDLQTAVFHPVATGQVSADGTTIAMDPGEGLEFLTWVAIAPR
ncbi:MAG: hypothetical protein AAF928_00235 [Myxococcota bacterium]